MELMLCKKLSICKFSVFLIYVLLWIGQLCTGTWTNSCSTRPTRYRRRSAARGEQQLSTSARSAAVSWAAAASPRSAAAPWAEAASWEQLLFDQELRKQNLLQDLSLGSISFLRKILSIFWHSCIFTNTDMTEQWLVQHAVYELMHSKKIQNPCYQIRYCTNVISTGAILVSFCLQHHALLSQSMR
jgi:hypothetical protein